MRIPFQKLLVFSVFVFFCLLAPTACHHQPASRLPEGFKVTSLLVDKSRHRLDVYVGEQVVVSYGVSLGGNPVGDKQCRGDNRTPEGRYLLDYRNPQSRFYKAFHISYPNAQDRREAAQAGCDAGGDIMIHGLGARHGNLGSLHRLYDWTQGCIAVTNEEIDELWQIVPVGTPIEIRP